MEQLTFDLATAKLGCPPPGDRCDLTFESSTATALIQGTPAQMERFAEAMLRTLDQANDPAPESPGLARYAGWKVPVALAIETRLMDDGHVLVHFVSAHHGHLRVVIPPGLIENAIREISDPKRQPDLH